MNALMPRYTAVQAGHNEALRLILFREHRDDLMESLVTRAPHLGHTARQELDTFLTAAERLRLDSPDFERFRRTADGSPQGEPAARISLMMRIGDQRTLFVLDTRHGDVALFFDPGSPLLASFTEITRELIAEYGAHLDQVLIVRGSEADVVSAGLRHLDRDATGQCIAAVEGTPRFQDFMIELRDGTIWRND
jgi:hypothetical protein